MLYLVFTCWRHLEGRQGEPVAAPPFAMTIAFLSHRPAPVTDHVNTKSRGIVIGSSSGFMDLPGGVRFMPIIVSSNEATIGPRLVRMAV